jgi:chromosomal replication initiation ATPase DnaA
MQQLALDLGYRPALGRADFIVAPSNELAVGWMDRWPDWPGLGLALHGPAGAGKTHLAQVWRHLSGAAEIEPSALSASLAPGGSGDGLGPRALLGGARACVLDGFDAALAEQPALEEGLFHLCNLLAERGGKLLLTGREPPARWPLALADLRSRLVTLQSVAIGRPDEAFLAGLLGKLFGDRQQAVPPAVIDYLVKRMERSFGEALRLVEALDRAALAERRSITVPLARKVLEAGREGKSMESDN